ncbi:MAG: DUF4430 domain-containing protein [Oscillospiraceae bacterium]
MNTKLFKRIFSCLSALIAISTFLSYAGYECYADTVDEVYHLIGGILSYNMQKSGYENIQDWIDGELTENAGINSEWYIIGLSQDGNDYDFSAYSNALAEYLSENDVRSAVSRQKYSLAFIASGCPHSYIQETMNNSIGNQGIMSWIYGLHLLNNGFYSDSYNSYDVVNTLLSMQLDDGGWAIMGEYGDIDVTAMTVQALAPYYYYDDTVKAAVDYAIEFLSSKQLDSGDYASFGTDNLESTVQVISAISSLGIDCMSDERFIKNDNTLLDGIMKYHLSDGSFSHVNDGNTNALATAQAFYCLTDYVRMCSGYGSIYIFDRCSNDIVYETEETSEAETISEIFSDVSEIIPDETCIAEDNSETVTMTNNMTELGVEYIDTDFNDITRDTMASQKDVVSETSYEITSKNENSEHNKSSIKLFICLAIALAGSIVCVIFLIMKKRGLKNYLFVVIITAVAVLAVCLMDIQTKDDYYNNNDSRISSGTVTLTIRCDTIADKPRVNDYIPDNYIILDTTEFVIYDGYTVFDVLADAAKTYNIQIENEGGMGKYISGINYLYEFDYGDLSGWMYHVNGEEPSVQCGAYKVADGDVIEWLYTCDIGNDLK